MKIVKHYVYTLFAKVKSNRLLDTISISSNKTWRNTVLKFLTNIIMIVAILYIRGWVLHILYFFSGQSLSDSHVKQVESLGTNASFSKKLMVKYWRQVAIFIPLSIYHFWWWSVMIRYNIFHLFRTKYFMSLVMVLGGLVAGTCIL